MEVLQLSKAGRFSCIYYWPGAMLLLITEHDIIIIIILRQQRVQLFQYRSLTNVS